MSPKAVAPLLAGVAMLASAAAAEPDVRGSWTATLTGTPTPEQQFTISTQAGGAITGEGSAGGYTWDVTGTVSGQTITMSWPYRGLSYTVSLTGEVDAAGTAISNGTWSDGGSSGAWTAVRAGAGDALDWSRGWDVASEPLGGGGVALKVQGRKLALTFSVAGAKPNKLYQVGVHVACTGDARFGQFPFAGGRRCGPITRDGQTREIQAAELAVMTTDASGAGKASVVVGPLASGTYDLHFHARTGAGCNTALGSSQSPGQSNCAVVFRTPAPFGDFRRVVIP